MGFNSKMSPTPIEDTYSDDDHFALARQLTTPVWVYDIENDCIFKANQAACEIWDAETESDLIARDFASDMSVTVKERLFQYQSDFLKHDVKFREAWTLYPNGSPITMEIFFSGFNLPDGRMAMMCEAIGEANETPENLRSAEALLHTDILIALFSKTGKPLYMNPAARSVFPFEQSDIEDAFYDIEDIAALERECRQSGMGRKVAKVKTSAGVRWLDFSAKTCLDAATGDHAFLVTAVDVTELKTARDTARYLADRDQLTDCFNRTYMHRFLDLISNSYDGSPSHHALILIDIDRFKHMNDTYGHDVGDKVLVAFAEHMKTRLDEKDRIFRLGGDEFLIFLKDIEKPENLAYDLTHISRKIDVPLDTGLKKIEVTLSAGVSILEASSETNWVQHTQRADFALYHSKKSGRNQYTIYDEKLNADIQKRKWLEVEIAKALSERHFAVHYQPRVLLSTGQIIGAEALIRWNHSECGFIPPMDFIPICEEMGLIDELGRFVLERVTEDFNALHAQGLKINISVNVSPSQFENDIPTEFEKILSTAKFPIENLELELTETSLAGDDADVSRKIQAITDMGIRLALDDFGTGYSNLAYISGFPVKCIKLDKSFVQKLPTSGPLLKLIFALANQIGADTVAEGVETFEQLDWLCENNCTEAQGFLFYHALPMEELTKILTSRNSTQSLLHEDGESSMQQHRSIA